MSQPDSAHVHLQTHHPLQRSLHRHSAAVLYFKTIQLTGSMDSQIAGYIKELEEKNLAIQAENPKDPFNESDRKRLIEIINALQRYAHQQINGNKK